MSTKAQINANRQNAQKSTGPRTADGKGAVSQNAVKHGLFAAEAVISGEDPAVYEDFHDKFFADLAPVGMAESVLAERIVSLSWRLRRAERMQNQSIDVMIALAETDSWQKMHRDKTFEAQDPRAGGLDLLLGWATRFDFSDSRILERLLLYERRIENSMIKMMKELKRFQIMRRIEKQDAGKRIDPSPSLRDEAATRSTPAQNISDLKKQSQFAADHLIAKSLMEGEYGNMPACDVEENKANQSQSHASEPLKGAEKRDKSVAAATG
ncbi:MAG: hypothetical protein JRE28_16935 [Deltaproteobacteria bacterium]|nr:hypothetical protein [Deltaproteobacteria bacterium]